MKVLGRLGLIGMLCLGASSELLAAPKVTKENYNFLFDSESLRCEDTRKSTMGMVMAMGVAMGDIKFIDVTEIHSKGGLIGNAARWVGTTKKKEKVFMITFDNLDACEYHKFYAIKNLENR